MAWVALMMVVLLMVAALVIDVGAMYVERRQLQNGADAAALAVAQECSNGSCGDEWAIAGQYTDLNASGGDADVVCGEDPSGGLAPCTEPAPEAAAGAVGWVLVRTTNNVDFELMPGSRTLIATAAAAYGPMGSGVGAPLIFSVCEFEAMGGSLEDGTFPSGTNYIYFHGVGGTKEPGVASCTASPSGQDLPGGFGWVTATLTGCQGSYTAGEWVNAEPGNAASQACRAGLQRWLNNEIVILMFDAERGQGANGQYHVAGFASFRLLGYRFPGERAPRGFTCPAGGNTSCVYGEFTKVSTSGTSFGGGDFGVRVIRMVG